MSATRYLLVTADDYAIGPETSRAIRELSQEGVVTSTVLLVNSPFAITDVEQWRRSGQSLELGWHPCLTMDRPVLPPDQVPSLVDREGLFHSLGSLLSRMTLGLVRSREIRAELAAQLKLFVELVGSWPSNVNGHKHIHVFPLIGAALRDLLADLPVPPYLRQLREPWSMFWRIPGARVKRVFLSGWGKRAARLQAQDGLAGNDWFAGVTDPPWVKDPAFLTRWLERTPGEIVELMVHPGHYDETLIGRDSTGNDRLLERRVDEYRLLENPDFRSVCQKARFQLVTAAELIHRCRKGSRHAA